MTADLLLRAWCLTLSRLTASDDPERGDVPGWVMITIMSAGLVVAILAALRGQIGSLVTEAIDSVRSSSGGAGG